ncbi:MAG: hypothetical protein ACPGUV_02005 [Polyangiales bacterium]
MQVHRLELKCFTTAPANFAPAQLIPIFHDWVRTQPFDELLIDVADYQHVHHGPAVLLVGHAFDVVYDLSDGEAGLALVGKRALTGDVSEKLRGAFVRLSQVAQALAAPPAQGGVALEAPGERWQLRLLDGLHGKDTEANAIALAQQVQAVLDAGPGTCKATCTRHARRAAPLCLQIELAPALPWQAWAGDRAATDRA